MRKSKIRVDIPDDGRVKSRLEHFAAEHPHKSLSVRASVCGGKLSVTALVGGNFFSESADDTDISASLDVILGRIGAGIGAVRREECSRDEFVLSVQNSEPPALGPYRGAGEARAEYSAHGIKSGERIFPSLSVPLMSDSQAEERLSNAKEPFFIYRANDGIFIIWHSENVLSRAPIDITSEGAEGQPE